MLRHAYDTVIHKKNVCLSTYNMRWVPLVPTNTPKYLGVQLHAFFFTRTSMTTTCNRFILQKKPHFFILNDNKDKKQISFTKNHQNIVLPVQNLGGGAFGLSYLDIYSKVFGISFQAKCVYANSSNKNIVPEILPKQIPIDTETSD